MTQLKRSLLGMAAAALLAGGCAHGTEAAAGRAPGNEQAVVHVSNHNWADMTVYVVTGTMRQRLGTVPSITTVKFRLPRNVFVTTESVRLEADPIGSSRTYQSPPLLVNPGSVVEWRLENNLNLSSAIIR